MDDKSFKLSDGRALGFETLGDPDGSPLFFFHGTPGSRLVLAQDDLMAQIPGVRLILPERPGYGLSDPAPARTLLDWPGDVAQLADHLGLDAFAVAGVSGGGPHALACAYDGLAGRMTKALLLSSPSSADFKGATRGMAAGNRIGLFLGRYAPWLLGWMIRSNVSAFEKDPQILLDAFKKQMGPRDRALLADASVRDALIRDIGEAYRQGGDGHVVDGALALTSREWGFSLRRISMPVFLWHGEEDTLVSINMMRHLEREIPDCTAHVVAGAAHLLTDEPEVVEQIRKVLLKPVAIRSRP